MHMRSRRQRCRSARNMACHSSSGSVGGPMACPVLAPCLGGAVWQWLGRLSSSARWALAAVSSTARREARTEAETRRSSDSWMAAPVAVSTRSIGSGSYAEQEESRVFRAALVLDPRPELVSLKNENERTERRPNCNAWSMRSTCTHTPRARSLISLLALGAHLSLEPGGCPSTLYRPCRLIDPRAR